MKTHRLCVYPSKASLPKTEQLAWKLAQVAADRSPLDPVAGETAISRVIDNAAVAIAAINRRPVANARSQALAHPRAEGATLFGISNQQRFEAEWAAWANGTAARELDMHDTFLAADYSHPADNIPALIAVAQQCGRSGADLLRGILTAYEIQISLVKSICLHKHHIDHIAHLAPAVAAGLGTLLNLDLETIYQSVQQAAHVCCSTRQSRKGQISSWKAYAPAHAAKMAIEAVDRAMRGESSPSPIYEGEESIVAALLEGPQAAYEVCLPEAGEPKRAILESYTKEHSAEYQAQAMIDLAFRMRGLIADFEGIESVTIYTSHHTHRVIGTGSNDPQKYDPYATRETLDHSLMYIFAVALQDGRWHHVGSYAPQRAQRPDTVRLWQKIRTVEDEQWTRWYHSNDPKEKAFGGRVEFLFSDGSKISDQIKVANAHPMGSRPFRREDYIKKFTVLTEELVSKGETGRFLDLVCKLNRLNAEELLQLNVQVDLAPLPCGVRDQRGIF